MFSFVYSVEFLALFGETKTKNIKQALKLFLKYMLFKLSIEPTSLVDTRCFASITVFTVFALVSRNVA